MAVGGAQVNEYDEHISQENLREQNDELLALQSIYDGSSVSRIQVISSPSGEENGDRYTLLITVPILLSQQEVTVKIQWSEDDLRHNIAGGGSPPCSDNRAQLHQGGEKLEFIKVKFLPPVSLQVVLPPDYPSQHAPEFSLSCVWLTASQITTLCHQLDRLWEESQNLPVLYTWIDWLDNNLLSYLEIEDTLCINVGEISGGDSRDKRKALDTLTQYNRTQETSQFFQSSHECPICCDELPGDQFFLLDECRHYFCRGCMVSYCEHHVSVGTVEKLRCPDTECDSVIPPHVVQTVLPADEFDRWERLMLQKTLDSMTDVDWCPRCNNPVIREAEEDLNLGHCTTCYFSFCTLCRNPWHQGEPCVTIEDQLAAEMDKKASSAEVARFEEKRRKLEEELRSRLSLQKKTKLCPKCKVKIEKNGGCNMMKCRCGTSFCWLCGLILRDYRHFRMESRCNMLDIRELTPLIGVITPQNVDDIQTLVYGQDEGTPWRGTGTRVIETTNCPVCRYKNVKAGRNNHIKCRCCSTNYCFVCRGKIVGVVTAHFTTGKCPQHS